MIEGLNLGMLQRFLIMRWVTSSHTMQTQMLGMSCWENWEGVRLLMCSALARRNTPQSTLLVCWGAFD